ETAECSVILAVLLSMINKLVPEDNPLLKRKLRKQVWIGTGAGLIITIILGGIFVAVFYTIAANLWANSEAIWEGVFSLLAAIVTLIMGLGMIRVSQWKSKWEGKLKEATEKYLARHSQGEKWAMLLLSFSVVAREGLESFVFIAGGSNVMSLNIFFAVMTVLLLFISSGLFSSSVFELNEASGTPIKVLWKIGCCDPEQSTGWGIAHALFGWRNEATLGSTLGYISWWIVIAAGL
ncbi:8346_t:CDS:2, partial [Paraglomus occultum]